MKVLSEKEIRQMVRKGKLEGPKFPKKTPIPEDKSLTVTKEMLAVVKDSSLKTDKMTSLNLSMAEIFLKAVDKLNQPMSVTLSDKKKEWKLTPVRSDRDLIKYIIVKEV